MLYSIVLYITDIYNLPVHNIGIDQLAQVVQQNSATAQESAAASEEMNGQSEVLQQLLSRFKLKENGAPRSMQLPGRQAQNLQAKPETAGFTQSAENLGFGKY